MHSDNKKENTSEGNEGQQNGGRDLPYPQWMPRWMFDAIGPRLGYIGLIVLYYAGGGH